MAWSTRQLAELAGTSLRTVRHYHDVGLLPQPGRRVNGYKQYTVAHLVRLLRIKRLTELGFSLAQIADLGEEDEHPGEALRTLDAELAETIERLQRMRAELGVALRQATPTDLPPELAAAVTERNMTHRGRSLLVVLGRVLSPSALGTYQKMLATPSANPVGAEFDALPADADERLREELAQRMLPYVRELHATHPGAGDLKADTADGERFAAQSIAAAIEDVYNPAQADVLRRLGLKLLEPG